MRWRLAQVIRNLMYEALLRWLEEREKYDCQ